MPLFLRYLARVPRCQGSVTLVCPSLEEGVTFGDGTASHLWAGSFGACLVLGKACQGKMAAVPDALRLAWIP